MLFKIKSVGWVLFYRKAKILCCVFCHKARLCKWILRLTPQYDKIQGFALFYCGKFANTTSPQGKFY